MWRFDGKVLRNAQRIMHLPLPASASYKADYNQRDQQMKDIISIISIITCFGVLVLINELFEPRLVSENPIIAGIITAIIAHGLSRLAYQVIIKNKDASR